MTTVIRIEVLTPDDATKFLRECGMKVGVETLRNGIRQGVYPFGICVEGGQHPVYQIFKKQLIEWAQERAM